MIITNACNNTKKPILLTQGSVNSCHQNPVFLEKFGLKAPVYIDLRQKIEPGIRIFEVRENGKELHLPSWSSAGYLGAYTMDDSGNIFISPIPYVSLFSSPLELENILYKVDSQTGKMDSFYKVPYQEPPNSSNPYGITGMTYDCETNYLYTSSVAGSGMNNEIGRIQKIDLKTKKVISSLDHVDALGMTIFKTNKEKRLYFGLARKPEIYSILLDQEGSFIGNPQFEFSLIETKGGGDDKAYNITIQNNKIMRIKAIEFNYTLMASSDPEKKNYAFEYDNKNNKWKFVGL